MLSLPSKSIFCTLVVAASLHRAVAQINLGTVNLGASTTTPITVQIPVAATLNRISVRTLGAENQDFTDAGGGSCAIGTAYTAGASCTVVAAFSPLYAGVRYGAVVLFDSAGNIIGSTALQGFGNGPQANYPPGTEITLGGSFSAPGNIAVDGDGNVYIGDGSNVYLDTPSGSNYTQTTLTSSFPAGGIAVDGGGAIYIAGQDGVIHKETPSGAGYTETLIGSGMYNPNGISLDAAGNIYVADAFNGRILKETLSSGTYTQSDIFDCGSVGTQSCPASVASDPDGDLFVVSYNSGQILELIPSAGGGYTQASIGSGLYWPSDIVIDGLGNLYVADTLHSRIVKETFASGGYTQSVVPTSPIDWPWGLAVDAKGNIYISDTYHSRVLKEDLSDSPTLNFGTTSVGVVSPDSPKTFTIQNTGNSVLSISSITYPSDFVADSSVSDGCTTSTLLALQESCNVAIDFKPASAPAGTTAVSEDVNLSVNIPAAPQQKISVTGTVIGIATSSMTLTSAPSANALVGQSVTITATVLGSAGSPIPTGTVAFALGSTSLGNATLDTSGIGTLTTTELPLGADTITATYGGDVLHSGSTATLSITIAAPPPPSFSIEVSNPTLTLTAGSSGSETITIAPQNGFNQQVTLTCSSLPQFTTCTFAPASVTPTGTASSSSTLTIATGVNTTAAARSLQLSHNHSGNHPEHLPGSRETLLSITILGFSSILGLRRFRRRSSFHSCLLPCLFAGAGLLLPLMLSSCGGSHSTHTPPGSSTITVTATSGAIVQTATFTLTVQ